MKFTDIFIKRPVLAICLNVLILIAGYQAIEHLTVRQYPRSDSAVVTIKTVYVGAPAELVRGYISTPVERVIASADGIDYIESASKQGLSEITAHLKLNFDVNAALTQIQAKVAQVRGDLPPEAESPIINVESADNRFASVYIGFTSTGELEPNQLTDYLTRVVQPQVSAVAGVQKADILGGRTFAMRIWLKPDKMAALGISATEVKAALAKNNFLSAVGSTKGSLVSVNLIANTDLKSADEFKKLVVKQSPSSVVRLEEISDVVLGAENYDEDVRFSGQAATFMGVWVLPNANSLDVVQAVRDVLPAIKQNLPSGVSLTVPYDATDYIKGAIREVLTTLSETIAIVILVIFLFIGSFRSVLVPIVAIPLSLVGATIVMVAFGFTINLLTLLAIVLAVGLVVDDAIVMLENVERHTQEGLEPHQAAIKAARELVGPTIAMTITLAAVYAPIGIQGGLTGALFKEFAFTLAGAVVISGVVALTLSPMMSSKLLKKGGSDGAFKEKIEAVLGRLRDRYLKALSYTLEKRFFVLTAAGCLILLLFPLYMFSMKELAPREDQGVLFGIVQGPPNATLEQMRTSTQQVQEMYKSFPEYKGSFQLISPGFGFSGMVVKPWGERSRTVEEIEPEAWGKLSSVTGARVIVTSPAPLPGGSDFPVEFVISSTQEPKEVVQYAQQLVGAAFASGKFMFADTDLKFDLPQSEIVIDRDKANAMGVSLADIGEDISSFVGGNYVNRFSIQGRSYKVIPQVKREERLNPDQLLSFHVRGPQGGLIPLSTVASISDTVQPRQLNRFQQLNSAKIQGAIVPGVSINDGLKVLEDKAKEILPPGYIIDYAGESRQLRKETSTMTSSIFLALVVIFLVLAAQFESFIDPLVILAGSVPLALAGALLFVFLGATSLNIYSQVGLVTLVGLIAKNGILIVEFANKFQEQYGASKIEAVTEAAKTRLRPILMTTVATVVGHFPLILASGAGAGARNSIGITLVTGMIIGTVFTLFVVPVLYVVVSQPKKRVVHTEEDGPVVKGQVVGLLH
jgi:multidrug efflux pump